MSTGTTAAELRQSLVDALRVQLNCDASYFYELIGRDTFVATASSGQAAALAPPFRAGGFVARWLRVNNDVLLPATLEGVTAPDRDQLAALGATACVPASAEPPFAWCVACGGSGATSEAWPEILRIVADAARGWREKLNEEQLASRSTAMHHSHRLRLAGLVAASVAHEVRNPLAAIRSLVQFARDTDLPRAELQPVLTDVMEEVDRIDVTMQSMLGLSRKIPSPHGVVDMGRVVTDSCRFVTPFADRRRVAILLASGNMNPLNVIGSDRELRQVIVNVLLNACQACREGGRVAVTATSDLSGSQECVVVVEDDGDGVSGDVEHLFEPFVTTRADGTGLGLAHCRSVLTGHGGTIRLWGEAGKGTTVMIRLPLVEGDDALNPSR